MYLIFQCHNWQCTCIDGAGATVTPLTGPQELPTVSIIDTGHRLVVGHFHFFIIWAHSQRIFKQKNWRKNAKYILYRCICNHYGKDKIYRKLNPYCSHRNSKLLLCRSLVFKPETVKKSFHFTSMQLLWQRFHAFWKLKSNNFFLKVLWNLLLFQVRLVYLLCLYLLFMW